MIWWVILIEAGVFAGIFTVIVLVAAYGDRKYSAASIHNYPPDIREAYFKTHDRIDVSYSSANVILTKSFLAMAKRFPGGKLVFDTANKRAVKIMLKTWVKEAGITSIADYFSVESIEKDILPWMRNAEVTARGYMLGYNDLKDPSVPRIFRVMSKLGDGFMKMQIVRMDFKEK